MSNWKRTFARIVTAIAIAAAIHAIAPPRVNASDNNESGWWMAASGPQPSVSGTNWGRLILKDGVLTFHAATTEWKIDVTDIKRISMSEASDRLFEVESFTGETYYVAILDANMLVDSPRKAVQVIQRAMRATAARRE